MITISLCMIVKNEENTLPRCLGSIASAVDEIIIVDTGSDDKTKSIAGGYTDKVFDYMWDDDFSKARNFAFSKASMDYCMWLDADDVLESSELPKLISLKQTLLPETDVVMMKYNSEPKNNGRPELTYFRERLIRRKAGLEWRGAVHEVIIPEGNVIYSEIAVTHSKIGPADSKRNLRIFEKMIAQKRTMTPRDNFYYARELTYHGRDSEAVKIFEDFIESGLGWRENVLEACLELSHAYKRLGERDKAFMALVKSFKFDRPRAEICCELGKYFFEQGDYNTAVYWYRQALEHGRNDFTGGFVVLDCYDYIPAIQLCVCSFRLGDMESAVRYNALAGAAKPEDSAYLYNLEFFENIQKTNAAPENGEE